MVIAKNNNSSSEFGQRLSELLKSSNISQRKLAQKVGITEAAISRYINSDRTPNGKIIGSIANALHVSTDYLIYGHDDNTADTDYWKIYHWIKRMLISYHLNKNESLYFCYLQKKMENKEKSYENQRIHNGIRCR